MSATRPTHVDTWLSANDTPRVEAGWRRPSGVAEFVAGFVGTSNVIDRDGRRITVRPEKIRLLPAEGTDGEPARIRAAVYLGAITRYVCVLDAGGELAVVQQNLETSSRDVHEMEGRRVRLTWSRGAEFAI